MRRIVQSMAAPACRCRPSSNCVLQTDLLRRKFFAQSSLSRRSPNRGALLATASIRRLSSQNTQEQQSSQGDQSSLFQRLYSSVKEELRKNKELQENQRKLQEELTKLNESRQLKEARKKFELVSQETLKSSERLRRQLDELSGQMLAVVERARQSDYGKRAGEAADQMLRRTREAAEALEKSAGQLADAPGVKHVASSMKVVVREIDSVTVDNARFYNSPEQLRKRSVHYAAAASARTFEANTTATEVEMHKESRWYKSFKDWTETNTFYNRFVSMKTRLDESENMIVRLGRLATDSVINMMTSGGELAVVLAEIGKVDPNFDRFDFCRFCETDIIPNVLEAFCRRDMDVLKDWCYERAYKMFESELGRDKTDGTHSEDKVIDVGRVELLNGKMTEQGPVLMITFNSQQVNVKKDSQGKVTEGNESTVRRWAHVWVLCRNMEELNPLTSWKVMEAVNQPQKEMFL